MQVSTVHADYVKKHFTEAAEVKEYQTQDEANQDLAAGRIDATQADSIALDAYLQSDQGKACCDLKGYVAEDLAILGPGVGAGLRKEDTAARIASTLRSRRSATTANTTRSPRSISPSTSTAADISFRRPRLIRRGRSHPEQFQEKWEPVFRPECAKS